MYSFLIWPTVNPNASTNTSSDCSDVIMFLICVGSIISFLLEGISTCNPKFLAFKSVGLFVNLSEFLNSLKSVTSCLSILNALIGAAMAIELFSCSSASSFTLKLWSLIILGFATHIGGFVGSVSILSDVSCGSKTKADIFIKVLPSA